MPAGGGVVLQYEYHVVFSCSFGVPVLYFRVSDLGRCLRLMCCTEEHFLIVSTLHFVTVPKILLQS